MKSSNVVQTREVMASLDANRLSHLMCEANPNDLVRIAANVRELYDHPHVPRTIYHQLIGEAFVHYLEDRESDHLDQARHTREWADGETLRNPPAGNDGEDIPEAVAF